MVYMRWVIAIKREMKGAAPSELLEEITQLQDICLIGEIMFARMTIECSKQAIEEITREYGEFLNIEPIHLYKSSI